MKNDEARKYFEIYLEYLFKEVNTADSLLELWVHIKNRRRDRLNELNIAPAFFQLTIYSFFNTLINTLSKLFDSYKNLNRSDRNLIRFINFCESHISIFPTDSKTLKNHRCTKLVDIKLINDHKEMINDRRDILDNLFSWRDKYYNHFDNSYFTKQEKLGKDYPLKIKDLRNLIDTSSSILNDYSIVYSGVYKSQRSINLTDIDEILRILHNYKKSI